MSDLRKVETRSPSDAESVKVDSPAKKAGGASAVFSSLRHARKEAGLGRAAKSLLKMNQKDGFDCPGCAWPDPDDRSMFEFCENGAKALAEESTLQRVGSLFFKKHSIQDLAKKSDLWLGKSGRLTQPMYLPLNRNHYEPISWPEALQLIASRLRQLDTPNQAIFYTSGRTSNEAAFLYQLMVRMLGTNNLPDCSNMCHESSGVALYEALGSGKGSVTLEDFDHADLIFVIGQNPGTNHPRMLSSLQKAARRGCKIISINPLKEAGNSRFSHPQEVSGFLGLSTPLASSHVPIKINGDVALLKGIMKALLSSNQGLNTDFIGQHTSGFDEFRNDILASSWSEIVSQSGISQPSIKEIADIYAASKKVICCWAMGLTQHKNAVANIQSVVNLLLLGGHFGRPGAGVCPVRGHSNVQGDRSMGITERPRTHFLQNLQKEFQFDPPRDHGLDTVESIQAMHQKQARIFFAMGGNFLSAAPDTDYTATALQNCDLTVHVSTKLNRSHLVCGKEALILPCLGRTEIDVQNGVEQFVTVENSMGVVHTSSGHLQPCSEQLKSEVAIVAELAAALFPQHEQFFTELSSNYNRVRDRISRVVPGFEKMNERLQADNSFILAHPVRDELKFNTAKQKALFTVHPIESRKLQEDQFLLMTIRSHDQYNTTIYGEDDRYRGLRGGRHVILMNPRDINSLGLKPRDLVDVTSFFQGTTRSVKKFLLVPYDIPTQCVAAYFPEANPLVAITDHADKSRTPSSKSIVVKIERHL